VLQCVAVCGNVLHYPQCAPVHRQGRCVAVCCSVLQCVAVFRSVLQCVVFASTSAKVETRSRPRKQPREQKDIQIKVSCIIKAALLSFNLLNINILKINMSTKVRSVIIFYINSVARMALCGSP